MVWGFFVHGEKDKPEAYPLPGPLPQGGRGSIPLVESHQRQWLADAVHNRPLSTAGGELERAGAAQP